MLNKLTRALISTLQYTNSVTKLLSTSPSGICLFKFEDLFLEKRKKGGRRKLHTKRAFNHMENILVFKSFSIGNIDLKDKIINRNIILYTFES